MRPLRCARRQPTGSHAPVGAGTLRAGTWRTRKADSRYGTVPSVGSLQGWSHPADVGMHYTRSRSAARGGATIAHDLLCSLYTTSSFVVHVCGILYVYSVIDWACARHTPVASFKGMSGLPHQLYRVCTRASQCQARVRACDVLGRLGQRRSGTRRRTALASLTRGRQHALTTARR